MRLTWTDQAILWNVPGEGSPGGAATETGGAADTGADAGAEETTSVLTRQPGDVKPEDAAEQGAANESSEGAPEGEADAGKEGEPQDTVPEDGVYEYTLPEGMEVNSTVAEAMNPVFKEAGLTQKQVDAVIGKYAELVKQDQVMRAERVDNTLNDWLKASREDPEIGGDNWDKTVAAGNRVLQKFGDDEIDAALNQTGAGVHPAVLRLFARIGKAIGDDTAAGGAIVDNTAPEDRAYAKTTPAAKSR